jgi:hypothetical protein
MVGSGVPYIHKVLTFVRSEGRGRHADKSTLDVAGQETEIHCTEGQSLSYPKTTRPLCS